MKGTPNILFKDALRITIETTMQFRAFLGEDVYLVRDMIGKVRVVLKGEQTDFEDRRGNLKDYAEALHQRLGAYAIPPESVLMYSEELFSAGKLLEASNPDLRLIDEASGSRIWLLERQLIAQDWGRPALRRATKNPRVTFYSVKGGVGRSTALVVWAWNLAKAGKRVLVFDLDLESPGVSATLLPMDRQPEYGIVDWFVEDAVGQAGLVENAMDALSPLSQDMTGEIRVVPAYGGATGEYLPKLARCYLEQPGSGAGWAERLQRMAEVFEKKHAPDVVFLDSRAGLHDIAAALVTRMDADALLFAVDSPQTWAAYTFLFQHWNTHPQIQKFRNRLQMVAALIPDMEEKEREQYLNMFREHSWNLFLDTVYDDTKAGEPEKFIYDLNEEPSPHFPIPILSHKLLQGFDPLASGHGIDKLITDLAFGEFMKQATRLLFPGEATE
jgi:cellulose biosynthesis protein BcsQ